MTVQLALVSIILSILMSYFNLLCETFFDHTLIGFLVIRANKVENIKHGLIDSCKLPTSSTDSCKLPTLFQTAEVLVRFQTTEVLVRFDRSLKTGFSR